MNQYPFLLQGKLGVPGLPGYPGRQGPKVKENFIALKSGYAKSNVLVLGISWHSNVQHLYICNLHVQLYSNDMYLFMIIFQWKGGLINHFTFGIFVMIVILTYYYPV